MNGTQSIIVYRNPLEQAYWEAIMPAIPYLAGIAAIILIIVVLWTIVKTFANNRNSNSYYYGGNSNKTNSLADL